MTIAEIKARLPLREVLQRYGLKPDASGRMRCPFHEDKTPSFQVYFDTQQWHCFAQSCQGEPHGDVIDFIRRKEQLSKGAAIAQAKAWADGRPAVSANGAAPAMSRPTAMIDEEARPVVLGRLFERFRRSLAKSQRARAYLEGRGFDLGELEAGYNSGQWVKQLMDPSADETAAMKQHAEALGLILSDGRAFARQCIMLPLKDAEGRVVSLYGRSVRDGKARHFYLRRRQGLYPGYPPAETRRLVLTEAPLDAASLVQSGLEEDEAVLALYGTNGWTEEHRQVLEGLSPLEEIILVFDGDEAGGAAAQELAGALEQFRPGVRISQATPPEDQDANDVLREQGAEALRRLLGESTTIYEPSSPSMDAPSSEPEATGALDTSNTEALRFVALPLQVTVLGGIKLTGLDRLRVTLKIERVHGPSALPLRHNLDLYHARQVEQLTERMAEAFDLERRLVRLALAELTDALEHYRLRRLEAMSAPGDEAPALSPEERQAALAYLKAPDLLKRTGEAIGRSGVVGEETNRLLMYLAFTSRLRRRPLQVVTLSGSGTGKTYLQELVSRLIPPEERLEITALSENALYYFGRRELRHKLLLIEDLDGADEVLYPLRELQSKGRLTKTVALKDMKGRIKTVTVTVEGPVCVAGCSTREALYADNESRCLVLYLDQSRRQHQAILRYQKRLSAGKVDEGQAVRLRRLVQNAQRLLKPVAVRNPYAERLALPPHVAQPRRTNQLYLDLIETVTFYHQYQRDLRTDEATGEVFIRTSLSDIEAANELISAVLTGKADELTGACRCFLTRLRTWMEKQERTSFYAGEVREAQRLAPTSLKRYLGQLRAYGYVEVVGGSRYRKGFEYELTALGRAEDPEAAVRSFLAGQLGELKRVETAV